MRQRTLILALGLIVLTALAYLPAARAGFVWDDDQYVVQNPTLRDASGLGRIWTEVGATPQYYPLVFTTFWLEARVWGTGPGSAPGYHLTNVLLHALAAVLLWQVLTLLRFGRSEDDPVAPNDPDLVAWAAALLWALHPVQVESVAWITERKNVLSGALALGALLAFLRWRQRPTAGRYALGLTLFALALLSKTVVAVLPAAALVIVWWREGRIARRDLLALTPLLLLGVGAGLLTAHLEQTLVGARGAEFALTPAQRVLLAGRVPWFYLSKVAFPASLCFEYPRWSLDPAAAWQWAFPLATLCVLGAAFALRRRCGRGPLAALLLFGGCLVPVLGFLDVYPFRFSWVADHFQYLASIPLVAGGTWLVARALRGRDPRIAPLLLTAAALVLGGLTGQRTRAFRSYEALLRDTIATNPEAWRAHSNLGKLLAGSGRAGQALEEFACAAELKPDDPVVRLNLALALSQAGRGSEASGAFARALALDPAWGRAHLLFADHLRAVGEPGRAAQEYRAALAAGAQAAAPRLAALIRSQHLDARVAGARRLLARGERDAARTVLQQVLAVDPEHAGARRLLAQLE